MGRLDTLQKTGVYALIAGGVIFLGEQFLSPLKASPFPTLAKYAIMAGAALFVLGFVV